MSVWKKLFLVLFFMNAMYFGGLSIQSDSALMQGFGFVVVIVAFVLLYVISQVMWKAMGFGASFMIIGSVVIFILYCLGLLGQGKSLSSFISGHAPPKTVVADEQQVLDYADIEAELGGHKKTKEENVVPTETSAAKAYPTTSSDVSANTRLSQNEETSGFMDKIKSFFEGGQNGGLSADFNPTEYPYLEGSAAVITASVLKIDGIYIKLLGIDAPDPSQTCADKYGASYHCGQKALTWLQNWLHNQPLKCHILGEIERNRATGVCFTTDGNYDVAAVVTNAGWAVAYTQNTDVYVPYEQQAAANLRGLWSGRFYKPWDWRKIQNRKVKITINNTKSGSGFTDWLKGLF